MGRRLRVVALGHTGACGGAELALLRLLDDVDGGDFEVWTVLFSEGPLIERLTDSGHSAIVLPLGEEFVKAHRRRVGRSVWAASRTAVAVVPFVFRLARGVGALKPDVIYANTLKAGLISIPVSRIVRRPLVWHIHDRISPDYLPGVMVGLIRFLARHFPHGVIVNSRATAATLPGVHELLVAYPGFAAEQVGPPPEGRMLDAPDVVGILGRISPTKGQLEFARAAAAVLGRVPTARFRIIGAPLFSEQKYADDVKAEVARLGIQDRVEFVGFADDPMAELDGLTVCVHASPTPEPFGQVIVEAMIRGVPVVATEGGGVTEIMRPQGAAEPLGWLVQPYDVDGLARAIVEALTSPDLAQRRAATAWQSAVERFPVWRTAEQVAGVWRSVARQSR